MVSVVCIHPEEGVLVLQGARLQQRNHLFYTGGVRDCIFHKSLTKHYMSLSSIILGFGTDPE